MHYPSFLFHCYSDPRAWSRTAARCCRASVKVYTVSEADLTRCAPLSLQRHLIMAPLDTFDGLCTCRLRIMGMILFRAARVA